MTVMRNTVDSGLFWLGVLPTEWQVVRGKDLFRKVSLPVSDIDEVVTCFRDGITTLRKNRREEGFTFALKESGYQGVRAGHLVVHAMDAFAGAIGIADSDGKCSPVYSVCAPKYQSKTHLPYYAWVLRNMATVGYIQSVAKGIRERSTDFRYSQVEEAYFALPPIVEQRRIATWLELQTGRINKRIELLSNKRDLLRDLRKSIVAEAVTKGLNSEIDLVNLGIPAFDAVPAHWKVRRLKECFSENNRPQPNDTVLSLSYGKVITKDFSEKRGVVPDSFDSYQGVYPGDIILRLTDLQNDQKSLRVGYASSYGIITSAYLCIRANNLHPKFAAYLLHNVGDIQKIFYGLGGGVRQSMKFADLAEILVPLPPLREQVDITTFLDNKLSQIDMQISFIDRLEVLLKKQRKAIIHEAVTGKIDLSNYEPPAQAA